MKKQKFNLIRNVVLVIAVLALMDYALKDRQIEVSDVEWECKIRGNCNFSFYIKNNTAIETPVNVRVIAHKRVRIQGSEGLSNTIIGDKVISLHLKSEETKNLEFTWELNRRPDNINVSASIPEVP